MTEPASIVWVLEYRDWEGASTPQVFSTSDKAVEAIDWTSDDLVCLFRHLVDGGDVDRFTSAKPGTWRGCGAHVIHEWTGTTAELIAGAWKSDVHLARLVYVGLDSPLLETS